MVMFGVDVKEQNPNIKISGFPIKLFLNDLRRTYKSSRIRHIFANTFTFFGKGTMFVHRFFLPELVYLLNHLPPRTKYAQTVNLILENTWMRSTIREFPSTIDMSKMSDFEFTPKSYQTEFIKLYDSKKQQYLLRGYILAFEQGLGKTFTSLSLMHCMKKDAVIIVAPKSTLRTVWSNEINEIFKAEKNPWVVGDEPHKSNHYIVNYESINKLSKIIQYVKMSKNIGIIVDECHNFRNSATKRVTQLLAIAKITKCKDTLLMSGTPIKALGSEMIPSLELIDPFFDEESKKIYKKVFGMNRAIALDVMKNRLGIMMHRKMKSEVLALPQKTYKRLKIKFSGSKEYTLKSVKNKMVYS